tara:strand:+ start:24 stop:635 length:612 start_codon:yes stop_codon:yes gene_type:complete
MKKAKLVLVRHGQSEWNEKNLFTGWKNPGLTQQGVDEATAAGRELANFGISFDVLFTSKLARAQITGRLILKELGLNSIPVIEDQRLNERDYGDLAGLNKDDARTRWGEEQVHIWRRSYDVPPPGGESLKDTAARVIPYFNEIIASKLKNGQDVLVAAHGNSLRALVMKLDDLSSQDVIQMEIKTGKPIYYETDGVEFWKKNL